MSDDFVYAFLDRDHAPTDDDLAAALGRTKAYWDELKAFVVDECGPVTPQWKLYTKKSGWTLVLRGKKVNILYLTASNKFFRAGFLYSEKAAEAALASKLPDDIKTMVRTAPKYPEGRGLRFNVTAKKQVAPIKQLIRIRVNV